MHTGYASGAQCDVLGDMEELGKLVKRARERRGLTTQQAAADAIGINLSKYNRLENGVTKELPVPDDLHRIGDALGLSIEDMLIAAGYLEVPSTEPSDVITIRRDDPRARVAEIMDTLSDDEVAAWIAALQVLTNAASINANRGIDSAKGTTMLHNRKTTA